MTDTAKLRAALNEQARLRGQMQHELRNSLQIVASMVALAARDADTPGVRQLHDVIQAQIQTLSLVQHWLYRDDAGSSIDLGGMVAQLCTALEGRLATADHPDVRIACTIRAGVLPAEQAVPLGFLITELALLAGQHTPAGPLHLAVQIDMRSGLALAAAGFRGGQPLAGTLSTARIIRAMAAQLGGRPVHDGNAGVIRVDFAAAAASS
jgi:two-component sensor histidine kinase